MSRSSPTSTWSSSTYAGFRNAVVLLLSVWGWYPIAFAVHTWFPGGAWTTTIQVEFSLADVAAKVGSGALVHEVAMLRTAEDVVAGEETHPEDVWLSQVRHSEGVQPTLRGISEQGLAGLRGHVESGSSTQGATAPGHAARDGSRFGGS